MWGALGRGPVESECQHQHSEGGKVKGGGGGRLFPSLIKERIHRDVLGVCNAALWIKEEQSAKNNNNKEQKKKLWTCAGETPLRQSLRGELFVLL